MHRRSSEIARQLMDKDQYASKHPSAHAGGRDLHPLRRRRSTFASSSDVSGSRSRSDLIQATLKGNHGQVIDGNLRIVSTIETNQEILCCQFTEDSTLVAAGFSEGCVRLYNPATGSCVYSLIDSDILRSPYPATAIKHRVSRKRDRPSPLLTVAYASGLVKKWLYTSGHCVWTLNEGRQTLAVEFSPKSLRFATGGDDGRVFIYNEETMQRELVLQPGQNPSVMDGHRSRVFAINFHPKSPWEVISAGWDNTVQFWDLRTGGTVRHIIGPHVCGEGLDIHRNGKEILTCSWSKTESMQVWDYGSGNCITSIQPDVFTSMLYCGKYINKDYIVAGGSDANLIRVVNRSSFTTIGMIRGLPSGVYSTDSSPMHIPRASLCLPGDQSTIDVSQGKPLDFLPRILFCAGKKLYCLDSWLKT